MLKIKASILADAIKTVIPAIPQKPTHPILGNILLETVENTVILKAFDLSTSITVSIPEIDVSEETKIAIPARFFESVVSNLDSDISISLLDDNQIGIRSSNATSRISYLSPDDYPELPEVSGQSIEFETKNFESLASSVLYAASSDELKQLLTGLRIDSNTERIELAATDGHRLVVAKHQWEEPNNQPTQLTIPAKAVSEILKVISKTDKFNLSFDETQVKVQVANKIITTRVLDGAYPQYNLLLPTRFEKFATFNSKEFLKALAFVSLAVSDKQTVFLSFNPEKDTCIFSCSSDLSENKQNCPVDASFTDDFVIPFNAKYLQDAVKNLGSVEFEIKMNQSNQPVVCIPIGGLDIKALVMPIQIVDKLS